jgi:hypothetical protein
MAPPVPSLDHIKKVLGSYSIASIRNWLKRCELPSSANSRDEIAERVHGLIEKGSLTLAGLVAAMIGIEEASSKRTFLYSIPHSASDLAKINKQLADLKVTVSNERIPSSDPKPTTKVVYVINGPDELRVKWNEMHKRVKAVRKTRTFSEINVPKVIVLIVNKKTGLVQLRCDNPEDEHLHLVNKEPTDEAYYQYFKEQAENLTGHPLEPVELRGSLEKVLKTTPRIVKTSYAVDESDDGGYTKRAQRQKNKDVRDLADWKYIMKNETVRTFEEAPLRWLKEMSNDKLKREVFSYIDATTSLVRFDADCYEEEIDYVLGHLV